MPEQAQHGLQAVGQQAQGRAVATLDRLVSRGAVPLKLFEAARLEGEEQRLLSGEVFFDRTPLVVADGGRLGGGCDGRRGRGGR